MEHVHENANETFDWCDAAVAAAMDRLLPRLVRARLSEEDLSIPAYLPQPEDAFVPVNTATTEEWEAAEKIARRQAAEALSYAVALATGRAVFDPKNRTTRGVPTLQKVG